MSILQSFNEDKLNRKKLAINLMNVIEYNKSLKVLAIDSSWGTGKTTFINMWMNMIETEKNKDNQFLYNEKFETMYFNAWENDYINNPIVSLLSEFEKEIYEKTYSDKGILEKGKDKFKPFLKIGGQIALKYITKGVLDNITLDKLTEEGLQELSNKIGELAFNEVAVAKNSRGSLKKELKAFQESINKKIIIFIDELDRCRPKYAIELLETIKHIFDIENFIFVISLDKEQLSESIKTLYGQGMDANGYLRRFFDLEYRLPLVDKKYYIIDKINEIKNEYNNSKNFFDILIKILTIENYSLRDIDKLFNYLKLIMPNISILKEGNYAILEDLGIFYIYLELINLKFKNNLIYNKIINLEYNINNLDEIFNKNILFDINIRGVTTEEINEFLESTFKIFLKVLQYPDNSYQNSMFYTSNKVNEFVINLNGNLELEGFNVLSWIKGHYQDSDVIGTLEFANDFINIE
ncbi:P-loop NTPase fold protein [Eubacterium multiforme]|uniref:RNAse (Barnase) inhibitor barstar n=1 Tax=Eubacterium multiforme TaxID=83339 RepID=A0ABT9USG1_9FIRM|nr:P-loop NTPase fold protein [Eubacterium multiforme]MDQ0149245.1 RNAse (barnase) inhibitor barstar [Eubacterium multiforme]